MYDISCNDVLCLEFIYPILILLDYFRFIVFLNFILKIINLKLNTFN